MDSLVEADRRQPRSLYAVQLSHELNFGHLRSHN